MTAVNRSALMTAMPVLDADEAGTLFRANRMTDFERRIKSFGLDNDPTFTMLLRQVESSTLDLEQLRARQEVRILSLDMYSLQSWCGHMHIAPLFCCLQKQTAAPWWADGEYSKEGADRWEFSDSWCILKLVLNRTQAATSPACRANEAGNQEFQSQLYSKAFDSFTNAIRLQPSSPVYHCNRAQAALKLGQFKTAILDSEWASQNSCRHGVLDTACGYLGCTCTCPCRNAIQRDPSYLKAYLKAGTAYYVAGEGAKAEGAYQKALTLNPACKAAKVPTPLVWQTSPCSSTKPAIAPW